MFKTIDMKNVKKMKTRISMMKNTSNGINDRLDIAKEKDQ